MTPTLIRHDRCACSTLCDHGRATPQTGHPPIPDVVPELRRWVLDDPDHPLMWWHRRSDPWSAVVDLHQHGRHDDAVALARLLRWCDQQGTAATADPIVWEISEQPAAAGAVTG